MGIIADIGQAVPTDGSALAFVDDNLGKTGNALHACEREMRQLSALSP
jgi:hypothetical protein